MIVARYDAPRPREFSFFILPHLLSFQVLPEFHDLVNSRGKIGWAIVVPVPLVLILALVVFSVCVWRRRYTPAATCSRCGDDLTGNVSGVCPECGQPTGGMEQCPTQ